MKDSRPSLILFIAASALALLAKIFDIEFLMIATKPMVIPAIFYYYLQTKTRKVSILFSLALWLFFVGDMIMVLFPDPEYGIFYIMGVGMAGYLILLKFAIEDRAVIKFNLFNIIFLALLLLLLGYFLFTILNLNIDSIAMNYMMYLIYGIVMISLAIVSAYNYLSENSSNFLYLSCMALCIVVSDLFYCISKFMIQLSIIDNINLFSQFMSYFFMVKYFNSRKSKVMQNQPN